MRNEDYLRDFLRRHGIRVKQVVAATFIKFYVLERGIFNAERQDSQAVISLSINGDIFYDCVTNDDYVRKEWEEVEKYLNPVPSCEQKKQAPELPKYRLTDEVKKIDKREVHRIECVTPFGTVEVGDKGGWVEGEWNLSQEGDCWIADDAMVLDSALVSGNARICDDAIVFGTSRVSGNAVVCGKAEVGGSATVYGNAKILDCSCVNDSAEVAGNAVLRGSSRVYNCFNIYQQTPESVSIQSVDDVQCYLEKVLRFFHDTRGIEFKKVETSNGVRYLLNHCLFNSDHKSPDAHIFLYKSGHISYKCFHASCSIYTWKDVVALFEQDNYYQKEEEKSFPSEREYDDLDIPF